MDLCEQSPSYVRAIAPYQPGKPISELAREMGLRKEDHQARLERESSGRLAESEVAIKKAIAELGRYPTATPSS